MERLGEVLFLLASSDRMKLLSDLENGDLRMTDLAGRLGASVQETSKHLGRLAEGGLIEKGASGNYKLTLFGRVILDLTPSLGFVAEHRDYFLKHDISSLPNDLLMRIGDLAQNSYVDHVTNVITECQHLLGMAREYFYWVVDQPLPWSLKRDLPETMSVRAIFQADVTPTCYELGRNILGPRAEIRFADKIKISFAVNEKLGGIVFPDESGRSDFSCGFLGHEGAFQNWCVDLFENFWENAMTSWPKQLEASSLRRGGHTRARI